MPLTNHDFIIFSSVDWTTHWQLHHQLAKSLHSSGGRVLFVENTGIRSVNMSDFSRLRERISNWNKGSHGFSSINGLGFTSFSPILLPFPYLKLPLFFNKIIFNLYLSRWIKSSNFSRPIVISFLPTPLIQSAIKAIDAKLTIYYCANNMAESSISASQVRPYEDVFLESVDIVFTTAYVIHEYAKRFSEKVFYIPPGIDFDKFESALEDDKNIPNEINNINTPIIGYIGALSRVLDQKLLFALADQCSDFTIVLIGPEYVNIDLLKTKSNIVLLGPKPHNQLPHYIKLFDVGMVPYICSDFTEGVYPSKLNEYLAMGLPVVSTNLREIAESKKTYAEVVTIAHNTKEFVKSVKSSVLKKSDGLCKNQRIKVAKENSWEVRFSVISRIIKEEIIIAESQLVKGNWKNRFNSYFDFQLKLKKITIVIIFSFLIIVYTPLLWFLGEQLIVKDTPQVSDAIVVFSGDGDVDYRNLSYQDRALDAVKFYRTGYAKKIFLSSGREQAISDVKMIKLYLVDQGVPESLIYTLDNYPSSTYENVKMVSEDLIKNNINSIVFLTAPYHSRRATMIWRKNVKNIKITSPAIQKFKAEQAWNISFHDMKIIIYEYTAIVYNWILGRI
jgi:uncharacterized SAM-binding protein YcdF (DUF218 family)/glycosyltransferase involved in cell wall biosynthesis